MKFIRFLIFVSLCFSCTNKNKESDFNSIYPPYKLIKLFSGKIKNETNLVLTGYGINCCLPNNYQYINGIGNFKVSYSLFKDTKDEISIDRARQLIVLLTENLLNEINSDPEVMPDLDVFPFVSDLIRVTIHFEDQNRIELGQGICAIYLIKGKIEYEGYNIEKYTGKYPAIGKYYTIHEESYAEALEIVKQQGELILFKDKPAPL